MCVQVIVRLIQEVASAKGLKEIRIYEIISAVLHSCFTACLVELEPSKSMLLGLSKTVATPVLDPPKMHYVWSIRYTPVDIFEEFEQHYSKYTMGYKTIPFSKPRISHEFTSMDGKTRLNILDIYQIAFDIQV